MEEEEKGRLTLERVERYLPSRETLDKYGYMTEVPPGEGGVRETEEGAVRKCDRCGTEYLVRSELTKVSLVCPTGQAHS